MIEMLTGCVVQVTPRGLVLQVGGIGFSVQVINPLIFTPKDEVMLFVHWNWSAERGPTLFGFAVEAEKQAFVMLLDCPKIGPQVALQLLAQTTVIQLLTMLAIGDELALGRLSGIGPKKAKTLVLELQTKAGSLLAELKLSPESNSVANAALEEAISALKSMGYQNSEITTAIGSVDKALLQTSDFANLTRLLLAQLLQQKNFTISSHS